MKAAVLYINGLGTGAIGARERFLIRHWGKAGVDFVPAGINWYDGKSLDSKLELADAQLKRLMAAYDYGAVILLGSSAGASLALQLFATHHSPRLYVVSAHGRLARGKLAAWDYRTLEWAAHLTPNNPKPKARAFYDSVLRCEQEILPALKAADLRRILVLKPLLDFVVPLKTMGVDGAPTCRSLAIGHKLAGVTDLVLMRDRILRSTIGV